MSKYYRYFEKNKVVYTSNLKGKQFKNKWLEICEDGVINVNQNELEYAWDGCSPKYNVFGISIGTPDGATNQETKHSYTYYASLLHDALYQFKKEVPLSRKEVDEMFYAILKNCNFPLSKLYYIGVRLFGWVFGAWKTK